MDYLRDLQRLEGWSNGVMDEIDAGRFVEAERLCENLLKYYPDQMDGHQRLAAVREAQGRWSEAVSAYDRALLHIERHPDGFDHEMVEHLGELRDHARKQAAKPAG
jgi:tetratricopeptide (TPR) repeat protein